MKSPARVTPEMRPSKLAPILSDRKCAISRSLVSRSAFMARRSCPTRSADRKSTRLNSSHGYISYAVFCLKKKTQGGEAQHKPGRVYWFKRRSDRHASPSREAQCAFKDSIIHNVLRFTLHFSLLFVLHRCDSQEILC